MSDEKVKEAVQEAVERNRRLIQTTEAERARRQEDAQRARESLRRAQRLIRKAAAT